MYLSGRAAQEADSPACFATALAACRPRLPAAFNNRCNWGLQRNALAFILSLPERCAHTQMFPQPALAALW